jgi:hypothetical protein
MKRVWCVLGALNSIVSQWKEAVIAFVIMQCNRLMKSGLQQNKCVQKRKPSVNRALF